MKIFLIALLTINYSAFAKKNDPVVATVNGKKITKSFFENVYRENLMFVGTKVVTKEKVLNDIINRELGISRAKKNKLDKNPVVNKKRNDVLYHAQISKDLEPEFKKIVVTDDDVKKYYKDHPEYRIAQILLRLKIDETTKNKGETLKMAQKIYQDSKSNSDKFAELANKYSHSTTAVTGGDIGFVPAIKLPPEVFKTIKGKDKGYISAPIRSQFGYHIVKILAKKSFNDIQLPLYKKIVYDIKRDSIINNYFSQLRKGAKIQINKDNL